MIPGYGPDQQRAPVHPWRGVLVPLAAGAVAGVPAGVLWAWWADPVVYLVTGVSASLDDEQLGRFFGVEVRYAVIGLVAGFLVGAGLSGWLRRSGWALVVGVLLGAAAGAAVSYQVGVAAGPPAVTLERAAAAAAPGDAIAVPLQVQAYGLFLSWGVGALAGLALVVSVTDRDRSVDRARHLAGPGPPPG